MVAPRRLSTMHIVVRRTGLSLRGVNECRKGDIFRCDFVDSVDTFLSSFSSNKTFYYKSYPLLFFNPLFFRHSSVPFLSFSKALSASSFPTQRPGNLSGFHHALPAHASSPDAGCSVAYSSQTVASFKLSLTCLHSRP